MIVIRFYFAPSDSSFSNSCQNFLFRRHRWGCAEPGLGRPHRLPLWHARPSAISWLVSLGIYPTQPPSPTSSFWIYFLLLHHLHRISSATLLTICGVGSPLVCRSPARLALSLEDPSTPPQSCNPAAPPWLPAPSSPPEPVSPLAPLGSLIPPAPPWSVVPLPPPREYTPPATPRPFIPLAPLGSSFAPPQSSVAPAPP